VSVRDDIDDYNRKTIQEILSERVKRQMRERRDEETKKKRLIREARQKATAETRERRERAILQQRKERVASVAPAIDQNIQQALRSLTAALNAAESVRVNRYTEEGRQHHQTVKALQTALGAVRMASRQKASSVSETDVDISE